MSTGAVVPGSGMLWRQPSVVVTSLPRAGGPRNGRVAAVTMLTTAAAMSRCMAGASRVTTVASANE